MFLIFHKPERTKTFIRYLKNIKSNIIQLIKNHYYSLLFIKIDIHIKKDTIKIQQRRNRDTIVKWTYDSDQQYDSMTFKDILESGWTEI